jgi:hypothetical protein
MPSHSFIPQFAFIGVMFLLAACSSGGDQRDVSAALAAHLQSVDQAQSISADHWDALILGDGVNCSQGLAMPPSFNLTQSEAERYPQAVLVRDHLNFSIAFLTQSAQAWDAICGNPSATVPPRDANVGYLAATNAKTELDLAQAAYNAWNP